MSKKENSLGANPESVEDDPSLFDEPEGRKLSKEMKIGVGVILLLVAVLGVVLANRLRKPAEDPKLADQKPPMQKPEGPPGPGPAGKAKPPEPNGPTMLTASSDTSPQPAAPPAMPPWSAPGDLGMPGSGGASGPPSFMPQHAPTSPAYSGGYGPPPPVDAGAGPPPDNAGVVSLGDLPPSPGMEGDPSNSLNGGIPDAGPNGPPPPIAAPGLSDPRAASVHAPPSPSGSIYGGGGYGDPGPRSPSASRGGRDPRTRVDFGPPSGAMPPFPDSPGPGSAALDRPQLAKPPVHLSMGSGQGRSRPPIAGEETTYKVKPNETFSSISKEFYGTDAFYRALAEHNRKKYPNPDSLQVGDTISVPTAEELASKYPSFCPKPEHLAASENRARIAPVSEHYGGRRGRTYTVQQGDSLFDIAKYELGRASRWVEIYELNRDALGENCNYLTPGMQLTMPENQAAGTVTQHPDGRFQR